jgi:hypothetical protein
MRTLLAIRRFITESLLSTIVLLRTPLDVDELWDCAHSGRIRGDLVGASAVAKAHPRLKLRFHMVLVRGHD